MAKGDLRRNKLHIPHPAASGRVRPFRCSSFSRTNRFAGFAREPHLWNPLKTTKKGVATPFLDHSQGFGLCKAHFKSAKNAMQMRIEQTGEVVEILCACLDFHTSNIQRALTGRCQRTKTQTSEAFVFWKGRAAQWTRPAACGGARDMKLARTLPEGRSLTAGVTTTRTTERPVFLRVSAISRSLRLFFAYFFLARQKWDQTANQRSVCCLERTSSVMDETCRLRRGEGYEACEDECPRSDSYSVAVKTAPPVNPEKSLPHLPDAVSRALCARIKSHPSGDESLRVLRARPLCLRHRCGVTPLG